MRYAIVRRAPDGEFFHLDSYADRTCAVDRARRANDVKLYCRPWHEKLDDPNATAISLWFVREEE